MKKKKLNKFTTVGLLFNGIFLISNEFDLLTEFLKGLCVGLGLFLIFLGIYAENNDISKLINFNKNLFKRVFLK